MVCWWMLIVCTIQAAFVSASKFRISFPYRWLYLYQPGTDTLDFLFAVLRKISRLKNFDYLELMEKVSIARQTAILYQQHLEWIPSNRLSTKRDIWSVDSQYCVPFWANPDFRTYKRYINYTSIDRFQWADLKSDNRIQIPFRLKVIARRSWCEADS